MSRYTSSPVDEDDDENFELVDYTAASSWERFVAAIETRLCQWRVNDGRHGDLNIPEIHAKCQQLFIKHKQYRDAVLTQISQLCTRTARLTYKGAAYALTMSVHPFLAINETADPALSGSRHSLAAAQFPDVYVPELEIDNSQTEPDLAWHPLHRWTGSSVIIYMRYLGDDSDNWDDDSFESTDNYSISLETAKLLMSSMNIAAQNVRCQLPMFAPVGDAWRQLYTGRMLGRVRAAGQHDRPYAAAVAQKYESISLPQTPSAYLQLNGLLELYVNSFDILSSVSASDLALPASNLPQSSSANESIEPEVMGESDQEWVFVSESVEIAALHEYRIKNLYSRDWNTSSPMFRYRAGDLNVGPANDPLRVLTLKAFFQRAPCSTYVDPQPAGRDRLYLKTATSWVLSAQMFPADRERTMLTEALEDAFAAWSQSSIEANRHRHLSMTEQVEAHEEITSDMLIDLFGPSQDPHITPPGLDVGDDDEKATKEFAARLDQTIADVYGSVDPQSRPLSITQLISRMPHGIAVPYNSLLWRLSEIILVATAKQSVNFWRAPSIMTFLRLLWSMALKEIRWRWENDQFLPRIPTSADYVATKGGAISGSTAPSASLAPKAQTPGNATDYNQARYNAHLCYSLIYQKLEMLNCCTERKLTGNQSGIDLVESLSKVALGDTSTNSQPKHNSASDNTAASALDPAPHVSPEYDGLAQRIRTHVKNQLRKRIGEGGVELGQRAWAQSSRIRKPIGRLLNTMRPHDPDPLESAASPTKDADGFEEVKEDPYASDSDGFVSAEDIEYDDSAAENPSTLSSSASVRLPPNAVKCKSDIGAKCPVEVPISDSSLKDAAYIDVTISSSMDSTSGFHHVSDVYERGLSAMSSSASVSTPSPLVRQSASSDTTYTKSESGSTSTPLPSRSSNGHDTSLQLPLKDEPQPGAVGGLYKSDTLRLLQVDHPMWIPRIQLPPVLTEDMLREREAILMSFGTSASGAKQRARLQSAELISDMESFKAANPGCILADFVRWHSPRDWIVPEGSNNDKDGALSIRMTSSGDGENLWQKLWSETKPVPASEQKLLFDYDMEAEKALHYLEGVPIYSLFSSLLPVLFLIAYERLYRQPVVHQLEFLREKLHSLGKKIALKVNWSTADPESSVFSSILDEFEDLEVKTGRCVSLLHKFPEQYSLVQTLVTRGQATVDDRKTQKVVLKALSRYNVQTAAPTCREYVFTTDLRGMVRDGPREAPLEQRMHVTIGDDKSIRVNYSRVKRQAS
ncbi:hypothetical protein GGI15_003907 [Coemansia interrupta]|uniref:Rab3 GTPase-activating protein catalytic subunit n=1 Tax=Coemansia interrupta TaxID=1126814 RepID=A0A9W8HCQ9_9FUNG|nr:hypothetical protein GGI15_003907 [Coemansia interrupta]